MIKLRSYRYSDAVALTEIYCRSVRHYGPRAYTAEQVEVWAGLSTLNGTRARCGDGRYVVIAQDDFDCVLGFG